MKRHRQESCLPLEMVRRCAELYPDVFPLMDKMHALRGTAPDLNWPDWCWLPMASAMSYTEDKEGLHSFVYKLLPEEEQLIRSARAANEGTVIAALAIWRHSKQIYVMDPDLMAELQESEAPEEIPTEALLHLPFPCIYVRTPGLSFDWIHDIDGFFCHLEYDVQTGERELRFLLVQNVNHVFPVSLHLNAETIRDSMVRYRQVTEMRWTAAGRPGSPRYGLDEWIGRQERAVRDLLPLVLYLCSSEADIQPRDNPAVKASVAPDSERKVENRLVKDRFSEIREWSVGFRVGPAIRQARTEERPEAEPGIPRHPGIGTPKRPHIRRGHWHHYWHGPRQGERTLIVRWLPPMAINADTDDPDRLPAVAHRVKGE